MNEPLTKERTFTHDRYAWRAHIISRINRLKNVLTTKWWLLVLAVAIGVGVEWQMWQNEKPLYTSSGRMIVSIKLSIPEGSVYTEELNNFLGTQAALMQSEVVIDRAYKSLASLMPNVPAKPVSLKVSVVPKTSIFLLQGTGDEPRYTQAYVQQCMEEYVSLKKDMRTQTSDTTIAGLTEEVLRLKKELGQCDEEIAAFQASNSVVLLQEQGNTAGAYLGTLNQKLTGLKSEYSLLQTLTLDQNLARNQRGAGDATAPGDSAGQSGSAVGGDSMDSQYMKVKQELLLLKAQQQDMGQYLRPKHPKMVVLSEEIARRERLLDIYRQQSAEQLEGLKNSLKLQIDNTQKDVDEWDAKTLEIGHKTADFQRLKANAKRIQDLYDRLLATMQTLDVNKEISPESVNIMENASTAAAERPNRQKKLNFGAMVGLACSLLVLIIIDRLDDRLNSVSEVSDLFDETVLAQIPREPSLNTDGKDALLHSGDDRHSLLEAYRSLRSSLLFMGERGKVPKTVLVTSSVPNDGKSITSANLAITLANGGSTVLLIDADLRKGSQHFRFGIEPDPGLSEALSQARKWTELVHETDTPRLSLLPRGSATQFSSELFLSGSVDALLKEAIAKYDFVIVDSAPVMAAEDVNSLAPHVDGVIFVIRAEFTSARVAHAALESLYMRQARILGLVFNSIRTSSLDYYHYYKYKDYYPTSLPQKKKGKKESKVAG